METGTIRWFTIEDINMTTQTFLPFHPLDEQFLDMIRMQIYQNMKKGKKKRHLKSPHNMAKHQWPWKSNYTLKVVKKKHLGKKRCLWWSQLRVLEQIHFLINKKIKVKWLKTMMVAQKSWQPPQSRRFSNMSTLMVTCVSFSTLLKMKKWNQQKVFAVTWQSCKSSLSH